MISFNDIPSDIRVPGTYVEIDGSKALDGLPAARQKILLIGQKLAAGTKPALTPFRFTSAAQGVQWFGRGSQLAAMIQSLLKANSVTEAWAIALDDNGAGVAATGTLTLTGPATANGTVALMIDGTSIKVGVTSGDSATTIATAVAAAVNAALDLPVTASPAAGVVTFTARNKGTAGNDIDLRVNYYQGETLPAGVTASFVLMSAGATNPDISAVWAAIGDEPYPTIVLGFSDAATLTAVEAELVSRWGPMRQIDGHAYAGIAGTFSTRANFGATRNGIHTSLVGLWRSPTPPYRLAAAVAGVAAYHLQIDPARPLTRLPVPGVLPPREQHRDPRQERELLLRDGVSTFVVDAGDTLLIERLISSYQVDSYALDDPTWLDVTTPATLSFYRASMRQRIQTKYPRHKLAGDDAQFGAGQAVVTPRIIRAELIALARDWEEAGLMEDVDGFIARLIVERDATNRSQLNVLAAPDVVNGFLQFAARIEFRL